MHKKAKKGVGQNKNFGRYQASVPPPGGSEDRRRPDLQLLTQVGIFRRTRSLPDGCNRRLFPSSRLNLIKDLYEARKNLENIA